MDVNRAHSARTMLLLPEFDLARRTLPAADIINGKVYERPSSERNKSSKMKSEHDASDWLDGNPLSEREREVFEVKQQTRQQHRHSNQQHLARHEVQEEKEEEEHGDDDGRRMKKGRRRDK